MKNKVTTYLFMILLLGISLLGIMVPDKEISFSERRKLAKFPKFELSNEYINKLEKYLLDQMPIRDDLRKVKAGYNYYLLNKSDNNGYYKENEYIFKNNYPISNRDVNNFINKTNNIKNMFSINNKIYFLPIPEKNYYSGKGHLNLDYDKLYNKLSTEFDNTIDIRDDLNINSYYKTDSHWKQETLEPVIKTLSNYLDFNYDSVNYKENNFNDFYGVFYASSGLGKDSEKLKFLTNDVIDKATVRYLENDTLKTIYNKANLYGLDPYNVFLDGPSSFIEITNNNIDNAKELVIFRDSFGSSIAPLLINYYHKITVIDNRYINSSNINNLIKFDDQEILFIYSTLLINSSSTLKG